MNLDFCVKLEDVSMNQKLRDSGFALTLVLAFFVLREVLVTTLQASLLFRESLTSYTLANPPWRRTLSTPILGYILKIRTSPRKPTRSNCTLPWLSTITFGGDGGVVLLFCLGSGGDGGVFAGGFGGGVS